MALTAKSYEFDGQEPEPQDRLLRHNAALRENLRMVLSLKEAIQEGDLAEASMYWYNTPQEVRDDLWLAVTKGGVLTTEEREVIKSKEFREAYYGPEAAQA